MGMELKTDNFPFKNSILRVPKEDDLRDFEAKDVGKIGVK
jgi:hypothetical protein